jgi:RTX calcium-binding nonapeptide repeat (4 copies)
MGADSVDGGGGADEVRANDGADNVWGGPGNDSMIGAEGADELFGGDGADWLGLTDYLHGDPDYGKGGPGNDHISNADEFGPAADVSEGRVATTTVTATNQTKSMRKSTG